MAFPLWFRFARRTTEAVGGRAMVDGKIDPETNSAHGAEPVDRKPWSTPRVILSEVRSTLHQVGVSPIDKTTFAADHLTFTGSQGS